jgi:hypothetical protein
VATTFPLQMRSRSGARTWDRMRVVMKYSTRSRDRVANPAAYVIRSRKGIPTPNPFPIDYHLSSESGRLFGRN